MSGRDVGTFTPDVDDSGSDHQDNDEENCGIFVSSTLMASAEISTNRHAQEAVDQGIKMGIVREDNRPEEGVETTFVHRLAVAIRGGSTK